MIQTKSGWSGLCVALVWGIGGCSSAPTESVGKTTEAIGTECAAASANMTFQGGIDVTSPQTYDRASCAKAQVYNVRPYDGNVGAGPAPSLSTLVKWADATPTVAACASAWVGSDLFVRSDVNTWTYLGSQSGNGAVVRGACSVPSVLWTTEMQNGNYYRVTASARTFNGSSAPTRQVLTRTLANGATDNCLGKTLDDGNPCTIDSCNPRTGVVSNAFAAEGTPCPDGFLCNGNEQCHSGACVAGTAPVINDSNPCTADSCDPSTGVPINTPTPGVICAASSCSAGAYTAPSQCDPSGACVTSAPTSCGAYSCGATACQTSCQTSQQCSATGYCDTASAHCVAKQGPGATCQQPEQCQAGTCVDGGCCDATSMADPLASTPISSQVLSDFVTQVAPLYSGAAASQTPNSPNSIDPRRVAVIRGRVLAEDASAGVPCAKVSVLGSPEVGSTRTRADGSYAIAVNGGGPVTIRVELSGKLSADRQVSTRWHAYFQAPDVRLLAFGPSNRVQTDGAGATLTPTLVFGDTETDAQGSRTARLLFPTGTTATVQGETSPRTNFDIEVKEMTNTSRQGHDGMIAALPVTSAFTYAVNLAVKGAENQTVTLSQAVPVYVDNFLGMPNGETVPVGYYDTKAGQWVASESGRVIRIVGKDLSTGEAQLDIDATPGAESPSSPGMLALGISSAERLQLAASPYSIGMSLWRFRTAHFSTWDCNWGWGPPGPLPSDPPPTPPLPPCGGSAATGSIIDCEKQSLREELPIAGTPFQLFYSSARQPGGIKPLHIPITASTLPVGLKSAQLVITVGARTITQTFTAPTAGLSYDFFWDGLDAAGRKLYGAQPIATRVGFTYDGSYLQTGTFGGSTASTVVATANGRFDATLWQDWSGTIEHWEAQQSALGGWDIDVHHGYDPLSGTLHLGDGTDELAAGAVSTIRTLSIPTSATTSSTFVPSDGPGFAVDADGAIYFATLQGTPQVEKLAPGGTLTVVAGGGSSSAEPYGDGGPAVGATLGSVYGLAIGPGRKLYIADSSHSRVRVVDLTTGVITNFAGNGTRAHAVNGLATSVSLSWPNALAVADDGTLYICQENDGLDNALVRVRDGQLVRVANLFDNGYTQGVAVAKDGTVYFSLKTPSGLGEVWSLNRSGIETILTRHFTGGSCGRNEAGAASLACLGAVELTIGQDGLLYIAEPLNYVISRITAGGTIETVAGTGVMGNGADGLSGPRTALGGPQGIGFAPDGTAYVLDVDSSNSARIRATQHIGFGSTVPSSDGEHLYVFDNAGHHAKTLDAKTGILEYSFRYDPNYLVGISDSTGHETIIQRDSSGVPLSITAPFGQKTVLSVVANQLVSVTDPEQGLYKFDYYGSNGLLHHLWDPKINAEGGASYIYEFTNGTLTKDTDPLNYSQGLSSSQITNGWRVTLVDQLNRPTTYDTQTPTPVTMLSTITGPDSLATSKTIFLDGRKTDVGPDMLLYSGHHVNPNGSSIYSVIDSDPTLGMRAPVASSSAEFVGFGTSLLAKYTSRSRTTSLSDALDLTSIAAHTETQTVNARVQPDKLVYDGSARKFTTTSSAGRSTYRLIDSFGRTTTFQVGSLTPTIFTYDDAGTATGKVSTEERNDGTIDLKTVHTYYGAGNGKMSGYPAGISYARNTVIKQSSSFSTDAFGRVKLITVGGDMSNFGFDGNGNLTAVVPPSSTEHDQTYTFLNQLLTYQPPSLPPTTPVTPVTTKFTYTPDRKLSTVSNPDAVVATRSYDPTNGRLTDITIPAGSDHYAYFASTDIAAGQSPGEVKSITSPYGANLAFTYLGGLATSHTWSASVNGSVAWSYDNDFARISETITDSVGTSAAIKFGYADLDKFLTCASLTNCSPPGTDALSVVHDSVNGLLSNVTYGTLAETYGYDNFGQLASKTAKLSATPLLQSTYDSPSWLIANRRDALGRISHREETIGAGATTKFDYTYSVEGRLTDVQLNGALQEHYDYGANGNRTAGNTPIRSVTSAQVQYDAQDRLRTYGPYTYTYTYNGELKTKTDSTTTPAKVTSYTYDPLGNLLSVTPSVGQTITYVIDGLNRRVGKKVGTTMVKQWLYRDSLKPVAELDGNGHLLSTFVYGSNPNVPDYMVRGGNTYRILTDQLGSPRMVVNVADSTVPYSATYTAFGEQTITGTADFLPFGFAGGMFDVDTGLVRFGARDYDPAVGRWTTKDPVLFNGDGPNLYSYVLSDPINRTDLTGEGFVDCGKAIAKYLECKEQGNRALDNRNKEKNECGGGDPGHDKAIEQKNNRCEALKQKAFNACKDPSTWGPLLIVGVVGAGVSLATGAGEAAAAGALFTL